MDGSDPVRFGLVGTGDFAAHWLAPALRSAAGVRFHAVLSRDPERARSFAYCQGAAKAYAKLEEFLGDPELEAVHVAVPDHAHEEIVLACARAGKHVLCEKPLAPSADAARRMRDACSRAGVRLGVAYHCRHHAAHRRIFDWIERGELGEIEHVRVRFMLRALDASNWRCRPPSPWWTLASIGTHLVDLAAAILTYERATDVFARFSSPVFHAPNDEIARLSIGFDDGATADLLASSVLPSAPSRLEVLGTRGWVETVGTVGPGGGTLVRDGAAVPFEESGTPYQGEVEDFARAVREGRSPAVPGEMAVRNVEILEAASRSSVEKRAVRI
jgi:predicted dehydrogenase